MAESDAWGFQGEYLTSWQRASTAVRAVERSQRRVLQVNVWTEVVQQAEVNFTRMIPIHPVFIYSTVLRFFIFSFLHQFFLTFNSLGHFSSPWPVRRWVYITSLVSEVGAGEWQWRNQNVALALGRKHVRSFYEAYFLQIIIWLTKQP